MFNRNSALRLSAAIVLSTLLFFFVGCSTLKHVPEGSRLLEKASIEATDSYTDIDKDELSRYIRQQPNTKLFGIYRFNLWLYNLGKEGKETGISGWLHRIGEAPVLYSEELTQRTTQNMSVYLNSRGFYHAKVEYQTKDVGKKKRRVKYLITYNQPTEIDSIRTEIRDTAIARLYEQNRKSTLLQNHGRLDAKILEGERTRLERIFRNQGFYNFSAEQIGYRVDTIGTPYKARLTLRLPNDTTNLANSTVFRRYVLDTIRLFTKYDPLQPNTGNAQLLSHRTHDGLYFYYDKHAGIRLPVLAPLLLIRQDSLLRISQINKSQQNLLGLGLYQTASFSFRESSNPLHAHGADSVSHFYPINCDVRLTRLKLQGYQLEGMLTTSGSLGTEGSLTYRHRNLFNGAEQLEIQLRAQAEAILRKTAIGFKTALEIGLHTSLTLPRFLLPLKGNEFVRRYSPTTRFLVSYNFQRRPYYRRTVASGFMSYNWKGSATTSHSIVPLEIDVVKIFAIDAAFAERIRQTYLANSYISQFISLLSYSFSYASNTPNARFSTTLFKLNLESAGNVLRYSSQWLKRPQTNGIYSVFDLPFAQYIKGDVNYSVLFRTNRYVSLASRIFVGLGYPYGNSQALPFEKRYYEGGANGVRAWHARDLGPGSYQEQQFSFPNQTGDLKLEFNLEYRTWLFWKFETALFLDMGNIWAIKRADERRGAVFEWDRFYKEIAMGYGLGLRLNLGFFLIRLDMGVKLHDPAISQDPNVTSYHWIPFERDYQADDMVLHFGVGYPF